MGDQESEKLEVGAYATSLHQAVKENDIRSIRSLVEGGAKVQAPDKIGRTPLHWALVFGHEEAARVLIINTPKRALDARDGFGCTALHYGAATGRTQVARILIERGAAINALDSNKRTPLHLAAQNVNPDMVELLTSRGADKSLADVKGALPFDVATDWNSLSSIPCLRPDTRKLISDKVIQRLLFACLHLCFSMRWEFLLSCCLNLIFYSLKLQRQFRKLLHTNNLPSLMHKLNTWKS